MNFVSSPLARKFLSNRKGSAMYVKPNFKSRKELKEAVARGESVVVWSPGPFPAPKNGRVSIEGPHFPKPHTWYADCDVFDGVVVKVR